MFGFKRKKQETASADVNWTSALGDELDAILSDELTGGKPFDIDAVLAAMPPDDAAPSPTPSQSPQLPIPDTTPTHERIPRSSGPYTYACGPRDDLRYDNTRLGFIDPFIVNYTRNEGVYMPVDGSFVIPLTREDYIRMTPEDHRRYEFRCKILPLAIEARREMEAIVLREFGTTYFGFDGSTLTPEVRDAGRIRSRELFNQFMSDKTTGMMFSYGMESMMIRQEERHRELVDAVRYGGGRSPLGVAADVVNDHPFLTGFFGVDLVRKIFGK